MTTLILMRHSKAVREHEAPTDKERGLTERGKRDALAAGDALRANVSAIDIALVSTAARTQQTLQLLQERVRVVESVFLDALYLASESTIAQIAFEAGKETILIVGHNPGLHTLAAELTRRTGDTSRIAREIEDHLPTSSFVVFGIEGQTLQSAQARLHAAWRPE
jgi:phosphohistidine phosphatase